MDTYNIPDTEKIAMRYSIDGEVVYIVTQHKFSRIFTLYSVKNSKKPKKLKTAESPTDFDEIY